MRRRTGPVVRLRSLALRWVAFAAVAAAQAQGTAPPLVLPSAIVFDAQGNFYFAETGSQVVRKYSTAGVLTTAVGNGVQGFSGDGGPALAAELDSPMGAALDAAGDLYIADSHNHRIRVVSAATGQISTVAGTGVSGFAGDGGPAAAAELARPTALAVDAGGNLYVADTGNHRVRKIAAGTSQISTVAGDGVEGFAGDGGAATAAAIDSPSGLAVDAAGNLFIADTRNGRVREVSAATGVISTVAGVGGNGLAFGGDGGAATVARLALPRGLTLDAAGNLYVADSENHRIRRISAAGVITTVAGRGTEAFAGDGAPAVEASLDTPRAVSISPAGLLTLADSGNQRVRQLDTLSAPGPDIHTVPWVGTVAAETLTLSGPPVVVYGSGSVTAELSNGTATGSVTFLDTSSGTAVTLGTAGLSAGAANFSTGMLTAGAHSLMATYAGDASHEAAQSPSLALAVTPLGVTATPDAAAMLYGQAVPALNGALSGTLAQDAGKVMARFTTGAAVLSPVGIYPIAATLAGSAAANYALTVTPANLTIAQAPTVTMLSASTSMPVLGSSVTLTMGAASTTTGVPTGSVTLLDGTTVLAAVPLTAGGTAFSTSTLVLGTHSLSAVYSGDGNFVASTSAAVSVTVGAASDFTLAATGSTSQMVPAGSAASFNFAVGMTGPAITSPITLAVQGLPVGATASFNPASLPPGGTTTAFVLTIQTPLAQMQDRTRPGRVSYFGPTLALAFALPLMGLTRRRWRRAALIAIVGALCGLVGTGCGDRINAATESVDVKSYTLTVTATATSSAGTALQHTVNVTLEVL